MQKTIFIPDERILSTQHIYGQFRGRKYMKKEGKERKQYYASFFSSFKITDKDVKLVIELHFWDKRRRDVDNYNKIILDSLTGVVYEDDSQIQELIIRKFIGTKKEAGIKLIIEY